MTSTIDKVKSLIYEIGHMSSERLAHIYIVMKQAKPGYTQDEIGQMLRVESSKSRVEMIESSMKSKSWEILELLSDLDPDVEVNLSTCGSLEEYLSKHHSAVMDKVTKDDQRKMFKEILGKSITLDELLELLEDSQKGLHI